MFPTLDTYKNFIDQKLHLWHSHLELKYFDSMYWHQWATTKSIKRLRTQAQKKPKLRRRLYNPTKVYPQTPFSHVKEIIPESSCSPSRTVCFANPNHSFQPCILYCFQCNSPHYLKWNCPNYQCQLCKEIAPGRSQRNCPWTKPQHFDDGERGYFDIGGEEDRNMWGECWILKDE